MFKRRRTAGAAASSRDHVVRLLDGRALGYAEYGDRDGAPVFYFHGTPGSRLEGEMLTGAAARQHVRLIAVDRPGFGLSDFLPKRRFLDWPSDVRELADLLGILRFSVVALSGGGPHAAACALRLFSRLDAVSIISGAGPVEASVAGKGTVRRALVRAVLRISPPVTRVSLWVAALSVRYLPAWAIARFPDPKVLSRGVVRKAFRRELVECFRHGVRGAAYEYALFARDWQFRLEDIATPVHVWHGERDHVVPIEIGRYVAAAIPNARATFVPGAAHLMIVDLADQVFADVRRVGG